MSSTTQQLGAEKWVEYFDSVAPSIDGLLVTIEVMSEQLGDQVDVERLPLQAINYDPKDNMLEILRRWTQRALPGPAETLHLKSTDDQHRGVGTAQPRAILVTDGWRPHADPSVRGGRRGLAASSPPPRGLLASGRAGGGCPASAPAGGGALLRDLSFRPSGRQQPLERGPQGAQQHIEVRHGVAVGDHAEEDVAVIAPTATPTACSAARGTSGWISRSGAPNAYSVCCGPGTFVMVTLNSRVA